MWHVACNLYLRDQASVGPQPPTSMSTRLPSFVSLPLPPTSGTQFLVTFLFPHSPTSSPRPTPHHRNPTPTPHHPPPARPPPARPPTPPAACCLRDHRAVVARLRHDSCQARRRREGPGRRGQRISARSCMQVYLRVRERHPPSASSFRVAALLVALSSRCRFTSSAPAWGCAVQPLPYAAMVQATVHRNQVSIRTQ